MNNLSPIQPKLLSKINETLVLRAIRQNGPSTRSEVTHHIGVTFPTTAKAVASLLESKLLEEFQEIQAGPGRPAKRLRLAKERSQVVSIAIDSGACQIVAAGFDGVLRQETLQSFKTPSSYKLLLEAIEKGIRPLLDADGITTLGLGVTVPGLVDYRRQKVVFSANVPIVNNMPLAKDLGEISGIQCEITHDCHALCLAERLYGGAKNSSNFAMLVHGAGIGLGIMIEGHFLTGHSGFAGEIGHTPAQVDGLRCSCGRKGCLESVASHWALLEHVSQRLGRSIKMDELVELTAQDDDVVREELGSMCRYLAIATANVINTFNPATLFVHSQLFNRIPWLFDDLVERASCVTLAPLLEDCRFQLATVSPMQGSVAAAINFLTSSRVEELNRSVGIAI